jgi:hypothetical protein
MHQTLNPPYNHSSCCSSASVEALTLPPVPSQDLQDLTVIGGGVAGLMVGKTAAEHMEVLRQRTTEAPDSNQIEMTTPLQRMKLLVGGDSLAYSPARGPFAQLLTLHGTDGNPRVVALDTLRNLVADLFHDMSFEFEADTRARKVTCADGTFRVDACHRGKRSYFESKKLVLALGHTLREPPRELRDHVIRGGGELCMQLGQALNEGTPPEQCLEQVLGRYKKVGGETLRIGLVGLGPSSFEVVKILETLLRKPDEYSQRYRMPISGTAVELVLYDPHIGSSGEVYQGLLKLLRDRLAIPKEVDIGIKTRESYRRVAERLISFRKAEQLTLVPHPLNWEGLELREGFVVPEERCPSCPQQLSVLIDCSPFEEGIGPAQRALIKDLDMVHLQPVKSNLWKIKEIRPDWQDRLAFAGAAILPRWKWNVDQIKAQAKEIFERFYGVAPYASNSEQRR